MALAAKNLMILTSKDFKGELNTCHGVSEERIKGLC
jgi:hypothetical protein